MKARDQILEAAYDLFSRQGVKAVGIESILERSGVARMTLYRHFRSKDDLVFEFLKQREQRWAHDWLFAEAKARATTGQARLLALFDVFDEWFQRKDFEGCPFVSILVETADKRHAPEPSPIYRECADALRRVRGGLEEFAVEAGIKDPVGFAQKWQILMKGSIIAATEGDLGAAKRAQEMGALVLAHAIAG